MASKDRCVVLTPYRIRIKRRGKDSFVPLDELPGSHGFYRVFKSFVTNQMKPYAPRCDDNSESGDPEKVHVDHEAKTAVSILDVHDHPSSPVDVSKWTDVFFELGEYGVACTLLNTETLQSRMKESHEASLFPFYARLDMRAKSDVGLLVFQEYGRPTAAGEVCRRLRAHFNLNPDYESYTLRLEPLVPASYLQEMQDGRLTKIRLFRKLRPHDTVEELTGDSSQDRIGSLEVVYHAPRGRGFAAVSGWLSRFMSSPETWSKYVAFDDSLEYERAKVEVKFGKKTRTLDLVRKNGPLAYARIDVSPELKFDENSKHPTMDSVRETVGNYMYDLFQEIGWTP